MPLSLQALEDLVQRLFDDVECNGGIVAALSVPVVADASLMPLLRQTLPYWQRLCPVSGNAAALPGYGDAAVVGIRRYTPDEWLRSIGARAVQPSCPSRTP